MPTIQGSLRSDFSNNVVTVLLLTQPVNGVGIPNLICYSLRLLEYRSAKLGINVIAKLEAFVDKPLAANVEHETQRIPAFGELVSFVSVTTVGR